MDEREGEKKMIKEETKWKEISDKEKKQMIEEELADFRDFILDSVGEVGSDFDDLETYFMGVYEAFKEFKE